MKKINYNDSLLMAIEIYRYRHYSVFNLENLGDTIDPLKAYIRLMEKYADCFRKQIGAL